MEGVNRTFVALLSTAILFPAAAIGQGITYELQEGSFIRDECENCDRIPIEEPIKGTLILTQVPAAQGDLYEVSGIDLSTSSGNYAVTGGGTYRVLPTDPPTQEMTLEVEVNETAGVQLLGGPVKLFALRPALSILITEPQPYRDPFHIYTIHLLAAPSAQEQVPYDLVDGSTFQDCLPCARPPVLIPLAGNFMLGNIEDNLLFKTYRIDGIDFVDTTGEWKLKITGSGSYRWGGEVALLQQMRLEATIDQAGAVTKGVLLANIEMTPGAEFPQITIQLEHEDPFPWYSVRLVARPRVEGSAFRRGDVNGSGTLDISDALYFLFWQFAGAGVPSCLEAADADGNGVHEVTDVIFILMYLFLGGELPPAPGPGDCGLDPAPTFGCASYTAC